MRRLLLIAAASAALGACSGADTSDDTTATQAALEAAPQKPDGKAAAAAGPIAVTLPQLAYTYTVGFVLPGGRIAAAQDAHRLLCERMGLARCQLLALERRGDGGAGAESARLVLRVASSEARAFERALVDTVAASGGRAAETNVAAEDVSKEIVDAEARIRQRELLVARLTEILRTRQGSVGDLVEAERSVAQAQEELDQAKGWLAALRGRVAMSRFEIGYGATAPSIGSGSFGARLGEALQASGATFLLGLRALLTIAIFLAPWLLIALPPALWLRRRRRLRNATDA